MARFPRFEAGANTSAASAAAITTSDVTMLAYETVGIYVGGTGNITLLTAAGDTVLFTAVPQGTILPIRAQRVNATGTTATLLIALF